MPLKGEEQLFVEQKIALKNTCLHLLNEKLNNLNQSLLEVNEASNLESKSSAGDKHETAKSMMQIEQEKIGKQIDQIRTQIDEVQRIQTDKKQTTLANGALIMTDQGNFYVATALGKILCDQKEYFVISLLSPIANAILKSDQKKFELNGKEYVINSIV